jgi:glycogen debranching enzyme
MFSGWGIRTLSSDHVGFNPFAYHLGSVWPSANAITARGLKRYGASIALHRLVEGLFAATQLFAYDRLPEVFGGNPRDEYHPHPGLYPGGCSPQAWSASAVIGLLDSILGITPLAPDRVIIIDPDLPEWLPDVTLEHIAFGGGYLSLQFYREENGYTRYEVLDCTPDIRLFQPGSAEEGLRCGSDRLARTIGAALSQRNS